LLLRVQQLILEAETLDFVEVQGALLRENLVDSNSRDWLIRPVVHLIEGKGSLTSIHSQLLSFRLKVPRNVVLGLPAELDSVLTEYVDVLLFGAVVSRVLTHSEAECLAHNIVKWHSQKEASQKEETQAVNSIELTPLSFSLEHLIDLDSLFTFSHRQGKRLLLLT